MGLRGGIWTAGFCFALAGVAGGTPRVAQAEESAPKESLKVMKAGYEGGQAAVNALKASRTAPPPNLTRVERAEFDAYMAWLGSVIDRMESKLAPMKAKLDRPGSTADAAKLYADFSDTMRILREEAAKRTNTLSNAMKGKHDTVKNSISNVR